MSALYVVATPIGNLEDITLRALRVLREVRLIAAEDTRVTRKLLARHNIRTPLTSYHQHNRRAKIPSLLSTLAEGDVALVSDAGTPVINDPGLELVSAAARAGVRVIPVPGPSAATSALAVSGLPAEQYVYMGFLPRKRVERQRLVESLASETRALVVFETPHRLRAALRDIMGALGDRRIAVCRELTKLHEEVFRGPVSEALVYFEKPRGEFTLVIEGVTEGVIEGEAADTVASSSQAREMLERLRSEGLGAKESVARVTELTGLSRRDVYRMWLKSDAALADDTGQE